MPLRNRLRRAFTRHSSDDTNAPKPGITKSHTDPLVYQPGEKMPPLKYKRPCAPEHKAHLESFSFAKAWRRRSQVSLYSPMGSRMPSRKSSRSSFQSTFGRRSIGGRSMRRSRSLARADDGSAVDSGIGNSICDDRPEQLREWSDEEGDVTNVGLSRNPTEDPRRPNKAASSLTVGLSRNATEDPKRPSKSNPSVAAPTQDDEMDSESRPRTSERIAVPFSPEELELALNKSNLGAAREQEDRCTDLSPGNMDHQVPLRPRERLISFHSTMSAEGIMA